MPLKIHKRGDVWHYRGTVAGRRLRGSTGTSVKETAQRIAAEIEAREWKGNLDGPEAVLTFSQAAILYIKANKADRFIERISGYWKDTLVKNINSGTVQQAAIVLYPNTTGATRNRQVIVPTQAIINHAAKMNLCKHLKVERFETVKKLKQPVTWEWVQAFMAHSVPHLGALCCFMFLTGARVTEAIEMTWADVDLVARRALIKQGKLNDEERRPHLPPVLVAAIANIESNRNPDDQVFKYSTRHTAKPQWNAAVKRAKIKQLSFHCCRHGFATALLHRGVDPVTVAKLGGWKSAQHVFDTYGHARDDDTLADLISGTPETQTAEIIQINEQIQIVK